MKTAAKDGYHWIVEVSKRMETWVHLNDRLFSWLVATKLEREKVKSLCIVRCSY